MIRSHLRSLSGILIAGFSLVILTQLVSCGDACDRIESDDPFAKARCRIEELIEKKDIASFQVAVARGDKIIFNEAYGWANVEKQIPATPETMHLVASIEKPFVSTALMILAERGRIDLHGEVNDFLGDSKVIAFRGDASDATIVRLMLHTTGMPYGYYIAGDEVPPEEKRSNKDIIDISGVLVTEPGTRYQYTNFGYGLLGDIIDEVMGENTKEFITREIIGPLNLKHTRFFDSEPPPELIATQNVPEGVLPIAYDKEGYTAMYSTASDLVRFGMFHLTQHLPDQDKILSDSLINMLWQHKDSVVTISTRRLGWDVQQDYGFETVQHGGGGPGIHNWLYMIPSGKVVISIMSNARYSNRWSNPVLAELIGAAVSESGKSSFRRRAGRGWPRWPKLDPADYSGEWEGRIAGPKGMCKVEVTFDGSGNPMMRIEGDECSGPGWVKASGKAGTSNSSLLWRFNACIPYLYPYAVHDEVILCIWAEGDELIGSASAAKEKNFGRGENYVFPQYVELSRISGD